MDKLVIDSNVYIDSFNSGKLADLFHNIKYPTVIYLSSVVLMELRAGAFTRTDIKIVQRWPGHTGKAGEYWSLETPSS